MLINWGADLLLNALIRFGFELFNFRFDFLFLCVNLAADSVRRIGNSQGGILFLKLIHHSSDRYSLFVVVPVDGGGGFWLGQHPINRSNVLGWPQKGKIVTFADTGRIWLWRPGNLAVGFPARVQRWPPSLRRFGWSFWLPFPPRFNWKNRSENWGDSVMQLRTRVELMTDSSFFFWG